MSFTLRFSRTAVRDIEQVLAYTLNNFGAPKHEQYKALIRQALKDIAADPDRPPANRRPELHPDVRTFHIGRRGRRARHFFVYRVVGGKFIEMVVYFMTRWTSAVTSQKDLRRSIKAAARPSGPRRSSAVGQTVALCHDS